jgi:hypothetical protein
VSRKQGLTLTNIISLFDKEEEASDGKSLLIFNGFVQQHFLTQTLAYDQFQVTSKTCTRLWSLLLMI